MKENNPHEAGFRCPEDPSHPLRVLHDEDGAWEPHEKPIVICCVCGVDAEPRAEGRA